MFFVWPHLPAKVQKQSLQILEESEGMPMIHMQIVKELGGDEDAARCYEAWIQEHHPKFYCELDDKFKKTFWMYTKKLLKLSLNKEWAISNTSSDAAPQTLPGMVSCCGNALIHCWWVLFVGCGDPVAVSVSAGKLLVYLTTEIVPLLRVHIRIYFLCMK